ncbi:MAG: CvpA family protein [Spirochaetota bacterium]
MKVDKEDVAVDDFSISIVDLLLIIVTVFFGFRSLFKGAIKSIFSFLGISASYLAASLYYKPMAEKLTGLLGSPPWLNLAGFSVLFLAVLLVFAILEGTLLQSFVPNAANKDMAGLLAFFMGLLEGFLLCSAILWVLQSRDLPNSKSIFQNSIFAPYYLNYNPLLFGLENRIGTGLFR